jgi:aspartyl-tRNA synthetase
VIAEKSMHPYRTNTCGALNTKNLNQIVRLSGWVHRKRDHGELLFIDLRDHYGITQIVVEATSDCFKLLDQVKIESVICVTGKVVTRLTDAINNKIPTGEIELKVSDAHILSEAEPLPLPVNTEDDYPEDIRLKYRYLDLRRERMHKNIMLRAGVIQSLRKHMIAQGFTEFHTPILTASSPEGARDYLVPSRVHPGHFYALPQAPQLFKQLFMVSGFDRYFQIAPCFRDEDARADRSPGEFYQLDFEMSFVTQQDVFDAIEPVLSGVYNEFANGKTVTKPPFPQIPYDESMLIYGSDKPDLRNPLIISDVTEAFYGSDFGLFAKNIALGQIVRAIPAPNTATNPRSFFDKLNDWARAEGAGGLGYIQFDQEGAKGPIAKFLTEDRIQKLKEKSGVKPGDSLFFVCGKKSFAEKFAGAVRKKLGEDLDLIDKSAFKFCWIVDFPMYELDEKTNLIQFSHNPFSMPQGGMETLLTKDPLSIKAFQYDIVCNGIELASGAIRNHKPEIMYKAFELAGYGPEVVEQQFGSLLNAFKFGAPPHGGCAPGVDRMVMLLADEPNMREVVSFPMNQQVQDLMMQAPATIAPERLKELHIQLDIPKKLEVKTQVKEA